MHLRQQNDVNEWVLLTFKLCVSPRNPIKMPALGHHHQMEMTKSVTFHDFCEIRQRLAKNENQVLEEEEFEDEEEASTSSNQHSNTSSPASNLNSTSNSNINGLKNVHVSGNNEKKEHKKVKRRGLPLNNSFSSWLQIFLSKKRRNGTFADRGSISEARMASIRPSVSLCRFFCE